MNLDYDLKTPEARTAYLRTALNEQTPKYKIDTLSDYILSSQPRSRNILTSNRMVTINKRETSYQGLVAKFENGEDGLYNIIATNARNTYLVPKIEITPQDIQEIPGLKETQEAIARVQSQEKTAVGRNKYLLKKQLIELRQQQYILKTEHRNPVSAASLTRAFSTIDFYDDIYINSEGLPQNHGLLSFFNPAHITCILTNYNTLKASCTHNLACDGFYLLQDFDALLDRALADYPVLRTIVDEKMRGSSNAEIHQVLLKKHNTTHTPQYISSLWRNKIPKTIAHFAQEEYLLWHYTFKERGRWKKCNRCGQIKLVHPFFFSKNNTSKDGFYSICKECRNNKTKKKEMK